MRRFPDSGELILQTRVPRHIVVMVVSAAVVFLGERPVLGVPAGKSHPTLRLPTYSNNLLPQEEPTATFLLSTALYPGFDMKSTVRMVLIEGSQNLEVADAALISTIPEPVCSKYRLPRLWNDVVARFPSVLHLALLQRSQFSALSVLFVSLCLWGLYLFRLRWQTESIRSRLHERLTERERIARDLHDTFFQGIQGLLLSFESASRRLPPNDPTRALIEEALAESDRVMLEGRELVLDLRSRSCEPNELSNDLTAAAVEFSRMASVEFRVVVKGSAMRLNSVISDELYGLCREALRNAFVHSGASEIIATILYSRKELKISVKDNGRGIPREVLQRGSVPNHWGLPGMRERATKIGARLSIASTPDAGTEIGVRLPGRFAYRAEGDSILSKLGGVLLGRHSEA
jgi:signal transduction histidine kinase